MVLNFKEFLEGINSETKARLYERATTEGIPVRRGERPRRYGQKFSSDVGDFGRGIYLTSSFYKAKSYGNVTKSIIVFKNPIILTREESYELSDQFHTVRLSDEDYLKYRDNEERTEQLLKNAKALTDHMISLGHDGLISVGRGELEIVDYRPYL